MEGSRFNAVPASSNSVIFAGNVSWTTDENATKTLDIPVSTFTGHDCLVSIKNASAVVTLDVEISNLVTFISTPEVVPIATVSAIASSSNKGVVVQGFPLSGGGRLKFTKSAATAAAFSAYIEIRRI